METRITRYLDEFSAQLDARLRDILGDAYAAIDGRTRDALRAVYTDAVGEVIDLAKKGKDVHLRFVQNVVLNAVDAIIGYDPDDTIFFWNRGAESTFGYTADEAIGRSLDLLLPDESYRAELAHMKDLIASQGFVRDMHTRRRARDGRTLLVSISRTQIRDDAGEVFGTLAIIRDMTEVKSLEKQVFQNEKLALMGQIAAGIAHEIGTPLNIISGIAECMLLDRPGRHPEREDLDTIIGQTDRIANLIRELLAFTRPQPARKDNLQIGAEIARAASLLKGKLDKAGIAIDIDAPASLPAVHADGHQMQQVFLNLLVNAVDALASVTDGGRRIMVTAAAEDGPLGPWVTLTFRDNGPGIRQDILARVFDPFVTTKEIGKGTGLGLAVCRRIIEDHGGVIVARSGSGIGAEFTIRLPAAGG